MKKMSATPYQLPSSFELPNDNFEIVTVKRGTRPQNGFAVPFRLTALQFNGKNRHQRRREAKLNRKVVQLTQPETISAAA